MFEILHGRGHLPNLNGLFPESGHALGAWKYYEAVEGQPSDDVSTVVLVDGEPAVAVTAATTGGCIGFFGRPAVLEVRPGIDDTTRAAALGEMIRFLRQVAVERGVTIDLMFRIVNGEMEDNVQHLPLLDAKLSTTSVGYVNLFLSEEDIWRSTRKSYRSLINRGRSTFQTSVMNFESFQEETFEEFRQFHATVAGRVTRPAESWRVMRAEIHQGDAELISIRDQGQLVGSTFVRSSHGISLYATGVYDRSRFDQPIAHWPVHCAILGAKARGDAVFVLGEVDMNDSSRSDKERNIALFKRGFASDVATYLRVVLPG